MIILPYFLWTCFSSTIGNMEGILFSHSGRGSKEMHDCNGRYPYKNIHLYFLPVRAVMLLTVLILLVALEPRFLHLGWLILHAILYSAAFPFWHDGTFYETRHREEPERHPGRWNHQSQTTTAKFSASYLFRKLMLIASVAGELIIFQIIK